MENIYMEHLLDHYKNPRNKKRLRKKSVAVRDSNPVCGDEISMELLVRGSRVEDIGFSGHGCAISQAAASMLTEHAKGKKVSELVGMSRDDHISLLGIPISGARAKCAMLPLKALKLALVKLSAEKNRKRGKARKRRQE